MTYLVLYIPVCFLALVVYETCRQDEPKAILRKSLKDFGILTAAFVVGSAVLYVIHRFL